MSASGSGARPVLEAAEVSKRFGGVAALDGVSIALRSGEVVCLLGDNGAGKSTLVRILTGVHPPDEGTVRLDGAPVVFGSPRDAAARGVAAVHQDLALLPLMSVWRNFWLGAEPTVGRGLLRRIDVRRARREAGAALAGQGIAIDDVRRPVAGLSGGERQAVAIARALHRGARVLVLDEPTAALGVRQAAVVLEQIERAKTGGAAVLLVTHQPRHAWPVGDRFVALRRGRIELDRAKGEVTEAELLDRMAGRRIESEG
ncbi:MAG TPA: ATP-binding cassette domain-containing protein [Gemmatimonadota bacterium]|nr:ATP-binding cassette domain-containing protein [Gemmatimonadota bacterium]